MPSVGAACWTARTCRAVLAALIAGLLPPAPASCPLNTPLPFPPQAWQHISGREGQALEVLARIAAETAAERQQKVRGGAIPSVGRWVGGGRGGGLLAERRQADCAAPPTAPWQRHLRAGGAARQERRSGHVRVVHRWRVAAPHLPAGPAATPATPGPSPTPPTPCHRCHHPPLRKTARPPTVPLPTVYRRTATTARSTCRCRHASPASRRRRRRRRLAPAVAFCAAARWWPEAASRRADFLRPVAQGTQCADQPHPTIGFQALCLAGCTPPLAPLPLARHPRALPHTFTLDMSLTCMPPSLLLLPAFPCRAVLPPAAPRCCPPLRTPNTFPHS